MRPVNLLPDARQDASFKADRASQKTRLAVFGVAGALLLVSLVLGMQLVHARHDVSDKRATLAEAKRDLAQAEQAAATPSATETELQSRLTALSAAASARLQWDTLLADLAAVIPKGTWLTSLNGDPAASAAPTAPGAAPTAFVIGGYALSQSIVAQTLDRLALLPSLGNVSLQHSQRSQVAGRDAILFSVSADVRKATG
jgi:Tfp pilus assembly protein PilN